MPQPIVFASQRYQYLRDDLLLHAGLQWEPGQLAIHNFPDGEHYHRILSNIRNQPVILLGGTIDDQETLELFDLANGVVQCGASSLHIVIPFFGYSTMERAAKQGEIVKAKNRAILFSALPQTSQGNNIIMLDLHAEGISYYFDGNIRPVHLYGKSIVEEAALELSKGEDFVLASTDAGRAKWVESLANDLHVPAAFVFKRRISGEETHVTAISADVKDKMVIIYDDMIRTGGSLLHAANAYKQAGAREINVITTHGLFSGGAFEKIRKSNIIKRVICTNSHPAALAIKDPMLRIKTVSELIISYFRDIGMHG